jgi:hypothetical protein
MLLLIHDERNDPISTFILQNRKTFEERFDEPLVDLSVSKILRDASIYDVIEDGQPEINWQFSDLGNISNSTNVKLISRVSHIPKDLFSDFHPDDQDYAHIEFSAYMNFALNAFPTKLNEPTFFGLSGQQLPMPLQWQMISRAHLGIQVPHYYLGCLSLCPFDFGAGKSEFIINNTYGYRHWKPGGIPYGEHVFSVRRPEGMPYFAFVVGDCSFVMVGPGSSPLDHNLEKRLAQLSVEVAKTLKCAIAELLFFVSGSRVTFGVADTFPVATVGDRGFESTLIDGIKQFFERFHHGKQY